MKKIRVGVIFGGQSGEHEVSLVSAQSVIRALNPEKYEVAPIGITREGKWLGGGNPMRQLREAASARGTLLAPGSGGSQAQPGPEPTAEPSRQITTTRSPYAILRTGSASVDVVFPVLHGPFGEDGAIQGLLEMAGIPYVGAGVLGSALGMDKDMQKTVFRARGLPVVNWLAFTRRQWQDQAQTICDQVEADLGYPCFTKPVNLGSSVGISKAHDRPALIRGLNLAAQYDRKLMVEQAALDCMEIECAVLGNDEPIASVPGEIRPQREFYDYAAKYVTDDTDLIIPAQLPAEVSEQVRLLAVQAFRAIDCAGMARVDFFVARKTGTVIVNEINTIPGFTAISMYPKLWEASGIGYSELVERLVSLALQRHAEQHATTNNANSQSV
jgi:D-alanine-D-alanine ligase